MILAMLLAHLIGDYVLQWDALAMWKSRAPAGVLAHGALVTGAAVLLALPFDAAWWPWALGIGLAHTAIDAAWLPINRRIRSGGRWPVWRLLIDQTLHVGVIGAALIASGAIAPGQMRAAVVAAIRSERELAVLLGYVFITLPAWILIEFTLYALLIGSAPDFARVGKIKYVSSLERGLVVTFVLLGQFAVAPLVTLPRLIAAGGEARTPLYLAEWLGSLAVAVGVGLWLRSL